MKKYFAPEMEMCVFASEDVIMISAATTEAVLDSDITTTMTGYEFISTVTDQAAEDVKAGAVFSWN